MMETSHGAPDRRVDRVSTPSQMRDVILSRHERAWPSGRERGARLNPYRKPYVSGITLSNLYPTIEHTLHSVVLYYSCRRQIGVLTLISGSRFTLINHYRALFRCSDAASILVLSVRRQKQLTPTEPRRAARARGSLATTDTRACHTISLIVTLWQRLLALARA